MGGASGECGGDAGTITFGAVVCGDGVDDYESDVMTIQCDGELLGEDVVLALEIGGLEGENFAQGRLL